jgi:4-aminobutyrate aminotransferase
MSGTDFYYGPQADLAKKLAEIAPGDGTKRVFFTNSGAEAVEAAFKLARYHTKRKHMIAFFGAFHGRTMGALSLTASKVTQRAGFAPLIPEVTHIDYPNPYRPFGDCLDQLENKVFKMTVSPDEVAAIVVEPIQGEGGYIVPPPEFHQRLKAIAERHGILYIADEVQSGMGRTGKMFAVEHWGVEPDILCLAKGIASGMPLGAIVASEEIMDWPPGSHASTFGGNPVSCAAALETIALLEEELIDNAAEVGSYLLGRLRDLATRHKLIGDVRGKGLMIGVELVRDRQTKEPAIAERNAIVQECFQRGLLLLGCGTSGIRFSPPLVIDGQDAETAVSIFAEALTELSSRR